MGKVPLLPPPLGAALPSTAKTGPGQQVKWGLHSQSRQLTPGQHFSEHIGQ